MDPPDRVLGGEPARAGGVPDLAVGRLELRSGDPHPDRPGETRPAAIQQSGSEGHVSEPMRRSALSDRKLRQLCRRRARGSAHMGADCARARCLGRPGPGGGVHGGGLSRRRSHRGDRSGGAPGTGAQQHDPRRPGAGRPGRSARHADPAVAAAAAGVPPAAGARAARTGRTADRVRDPGHPRPRDPGLDRHPAVRQRRRRLLGGLGPDTQPRHRREPDAAGLRARRIGGLGDAGPADHSPARRSRARSRHRLWRAEPAPGRPRRAGGRHRHQPAGDHAGRADDHDQLGRGRSSARRSVRGRSRASGST